MQSEHWGGAQQNLIVGAGWAIQNAICNLKERVPRHRNFGLIALGSSTVTAYGTAQAVLDEAVNHNLVGAVVRGGFGFISSTALLEYGLSNTGSV